MANHLPTDAKQRKQYPLYSGLLMYFPDALAAVANLSKIGNDQHNPGQPLHWAREKSTDQEDTLMRHLLESGTIDVDGVRHSTKVAWRALAKLQLEIEEDRKKTNEKPSTVSSPTVTDLDKYLNDSFGPSTTIKIADGGKLVWGEVSRANYGQRDALPTDQADGCASDTSVGYSSNFDQCRLRFNGDGDRNG